MKQGLPVILCIGSDKISGDSVGPIVGDILKNILRVNCYVYGVIGDSVNGRNIDDFLAHLHSVHKDNLIIAVDASLGKSGSDDVVIKNSVHPKRAISHTKNPVGDVGVLGVVGQISSNPLCSLMAVSIDNVQKLSVKIAIIIYKALFSA